MSSVLQSWVEKLGLRHQGVLLSAVRGCDAVPKDDASKSLIRAYRGFILHSFDRKPSSFIEFVSGDELEKRTQAVLSNFDHYPIHFILHLMHAAEILGYKHPMRLVSSAWLHFYETICMKMHLNPESKKQLDKRLNANEKEFAENK